MAAVVVSPPHTPLLNTRSYAVLVALIHIHINIYIYQTFGKSKALKVKASRNEQSRRTNEENTHLPRPLRLWKKKTCCVSRRPQVF